MILDSLINDHSTQFTSSKNPQINLQMETLIWPAVPAIWATILFLYFLNTFLHRKKLNPPPGPTPWPVIGNLNLIGAALPHRSVHELSQKYGPIMKLQFGSFPVVVASSVEMAEVFLKTMDQNFASRPKTAAGKYTAYNYSDILWSPYGPYWRQARKICAMELFTARRLESYEYIRNEELHSLLKEVFDSCGKAFQLKECLSTMNLNVIARMVLGKSADENGMVAPEFKRMLSELFLLNGVINIGDLIPWIGFLDLQGYVKRMKIVSKKFDRFLEHVLEEHDARRRKNREGVVSKDMVDVLLELASDPNLEVKLGRDGVKAFTLDMLAGGTESSTDTMEWVMSELMRKPEIFDRATEELDRVIGQKSWVKEHDIPHLPYIEAIVKETMRLHPAAPMLPPRMCRKDCKVAGYDILKGTRVLVNAWTIGRDPSLWENPSEFCPERFLGKDIDIKGHGFELMPFGAGRRMCPGYSLALKVIQTTLANLLHGFKWRLTDDIMKVEDLSMEETYGLSTIRKVPLATVVEPRLPLEMYSIM